MNNKQRVNQVNSSRWFSWFSQSFYFSFGYFAFLTTEYDGTLWRNLITPGQ